MIKKTFLSAMLLFIFSSAISAQIENDEKVKAGKRAEDLLQTIRDEKWSEIIKFVVVIEDFDKQTGKTGRTFRFPTDEETKEKIINRFKRTYSSLKPGRIIGVNIFEKDKTIAGVAYKHGDKDGFRMFLVDGEWYYGIQYLQ